MIRKMMRFVRVARRQGLAQAARLALNRATGLPNVPPNTIEANLEEWQHWDWADKGEEWTISPAWKASIVESVLKPNVPEGCRVLEIGPGGGWWTEFLIARAAHVSAVDLTPRCIEVCRERFRSAINVDFFVNDGRDLSFLPAASFERIWSYDVFVHIAAADVDNYVRQFATLLVPGGVAVIHHAKAGRFAGGWRSDMTADKMREIAVRHGLTVSEQFDTWDDGAGGRAYFPTGNASPEHPERSADIFSVLVRAT